MDVKSVWWNRMWNLRKSFVGFVELRLGISCNRVLDCMHTFTGFGCYKRDVENDHSDTNSVIPQMASSPDESIVHKPSPHNDKWKLTQIHRASVKRQITELIRIRGGEMKKAIQPIEYTFFTFSRGRYHGLCMTRMRGLCLFDSESKKRERSILSGEGKDREGGVSICPRGRIRVLGE